MGTNHLAEFIGVILYVAILAQASSVKIPLLMLHRRQSRIPATMERAPSHETDKSGDANADAAAIRRNRWPRVASKSWRQLAARVRAHCIIRALWKSLTTKLLRLSQLKRIFNRTGTLLKRYKALRSCSGPEHTASRLASFASA